MAILIKDFLNTLFNKEENWHIRLLEEWPNIVGTLKTRICLEKIEGSTIIIGVYESHWMQELHLLSRFLVARINTSLGVELGSPEKYVHQVKFKLMDLPKARTASYIRINTTYSHTPLALNATHEQLLSTIKDSGLRSSLALFFRTCVTR